ncbi:MAG: hypothetical protein EOM24_34080, partial [Chloroflexia bacterium]|nr:hypothetical protein [Chloroflexia bacterium]
MIELDNKLWISRRSRLTHSLRTSHIHTSIQCQLHDKIGVEMPETVTNQSPQPDPELIGQFLEGVLRKKSFTTYGDVVAQFGLIELNVAWKAHPLCNIFEFLDKQDAQAKRPFRTSAVISVANNLPGAGCFEALARLKGIQTHNENERTEVW